MLIPDHDSFVSEISRFEVISWTNDRSCSRREVFLRPLHTSQFIQRKRHSSFQHVTPCVWLACCTLAARDIAVYWTGPALVAFICSVLKNWSCFRDHHPQWWKIVLCNWNQSRRRAVLFCVCLTQQFLFASFFCYMYQGNVSESECEMASCSVLTVTELSVKWPTVQC